MKTELWPLSRVTPYERNPRVNDSAVDAVARSLRPSENSDFANRLGNASAPQSIDGCSPGQTRVFDVEGVWIVVRFVERKGRRGRLPFSPLPQTVAGSILRTG